jgi:hypothetical protein
MARGTSLEREGLIVAAGSAVGMGAARLASGDDGSTQFGNFTNLNLS